MSVCYIKDERMKNKEFMYGMTPVNIKMGTYNNRRPSLQLIDVIDNVPFMTATINVPLADVEGDLVVIKDYSENTGVYDWLVEKNIVVPTGYFYELAFDRVPICTLLPEEEWRDEEPEWDDVQD